MNSAIVVDVGIRSRAPRTFNQHSIAVPTSRSSQRKDDTRNGINRIPWLTETPRLSLEQENDRLNHALVSMSRGLLQYASQCALWTPAGENGRSAQLFRLATMQQESIQRLCDLLLKRRKYIDWSVFPSEYTSYNYVSPDFVWPKIGDFQRQLVRLLEAVRAELRYAPQVTTVMDNIIRAERDILIELTSTNETGPPPESVTPKKFGRSVKPLHRPLGGQLSSFNERAPSNRVTLGV